MKKAIFVTLNSFVGIPPVKQLILHLKNYYTIVAIQCNILNFENFLINNNIEHKSVLDFDNSKAFNSQTIIHKIKKYFNLCRLYMPFILNVKKESYTVFTIDIFSLYLTLVLKSNKIKIIYIQYEIIESSKLNRLDKFFFKYIKNHSDKIDLIITPEKNRTDYLKNNFLNSKGSSFLTLPNSNNKSVSLSQFHIENKSGPKIVTHVGAVGLNHHIKSYLEAISTMDSNLYEFRFIGLLTEDVVDLINSYPNQNIKLIEQIAHSELENYYVETDIGIILYRDVSLNYRFCAPNKLYEYWAYGIPVLGDILPGLQSVFVDKSLGLLVNMESPIEIVKGIELLSNHNFSDRNRANYYFIKNYKLDTYLHHLDYKLGELEK